MNVRTIVGAGLVSVLAVVPLGAQGHGHSAPPAGNPHAQGGTSPGGTHTPQGPKTPNPGAGHAEGAGHGNAGGHGQGKGEGKGQGKGQGDAAHGPMTPADHLAAQPELSKRIQAMLPAGMTLDQAAADFKNLGQFIAAVNVSKNLGIPFDQLKAQVTGASAVSLGAAIHTLKPNADASAEVKHATAEAEAMTGDKK